MIEQQTPNDIPFTDKNPCGLMSGHNHAEHFDGWIVCTTKNIKWPSFHLPGKNEQCFNTEHEHHSLLGWAYCTEGEQCYWAVSEQRRAEQSARATAIVTGSVGATETREFRKADGTLEIQALAIYKTVKEAGK